MFVRCVCRERASTDPALNTYYIITGEISRTQNNYVLEHWGHALFGTLCSQHSWTMQRVHNTEHRTSVLADTRTGITIYIYMNWSSVLVVVVVVHSSAEVLHSADVYICVDGCNLSRCEFISSKSFSSSMTFWWLFVIDVLRDGY